MQELLLYMGGGIRCLDWDTGPGSNCMQYDPDDDSGFFGTVPESGLLTASEITSLTQLTEGSVRSEPITWLKCYLDGKVLFISKKTVRYNIKHSTLKNLNLLDGSKQLLVKGKYYKVRLLEGLNKDTRVNIASGYDIEATWHSEWNRLMYRISLDAAPRHKYSQLGPNWLEYPQNDTDNGLNISNGLGFYNWCAENNPGNPSQGIMRGGGSVTRVHPSLSSYSDNNYGWRPVLELIR